MKTVFFGTPDSAVPSVQALVGISEVMAVVTRPDAPRGRSGRPQPSAVARFAEDAGIPVLRPSGRAGLAEAVGSVGDFEVGVVVAFGMIVRPEVLAIPARGYVNVHFSLLPRWRGAAPVQRSILAGDDRTGVTLMRMDEGLDTGSIVSTWSTAIGAGEDAGALTDRLAVGGAGLLAANLEAYVEGRIATTRQDDTRATYARKLDSVERWVGPGHTVEEVVRAVRAFVPWPGAWIRHGSGPIRLHRAEWSDIAPPPGEIEVQGSGVVCGFADGGVRVDQVQPTGRQPMNARDWIRGLRAGPGRFG